MSLNQTPSAERTRIGFFGLRNAGKSSLVNAVTGQSMSIVSSVAGTTTDPVRKTMEILPLGPVVIVDTPGIDDEGALGTQRVEKTLKEIQAIDVAVLAVDGTRGLTAVDEGLLQEFAAKQVPCFVCLTKADLLAEEQVALPEVELAHAVLRVSSTTGRGIHQLKELIGKVAQTAGLEERFVIGDLVKPGDVVVLVTPIDGSAPKKRMIMPQQMCIREVLDANGMPCCCQVGELDQLLKALTVPPALVVTDSQAFEAVAAIVPETVALTSFSILMARYKGNLRHQLDCVNVLDALAEGDRVLVAEACTHHRQCEDIGTVKIPAWMQAYAGCNLDFSFCAGKDFPDDLSPYKLVVHCGACMIGQREMKSRVASARQQGVALTNYGMLIAKATGVLAKPNLVLGQ